MPRLGRASRSDPAEDGGQCRAAGWSSRGHCEACRRRTNPQAVPCIFAIERGYAHGKSEGTKTEANLAAAFAGESQARNKYTYYASKAKKDGMSRLPPCSWRPPTT